MTERNQQAGPWKWIERVSLFTVLAFCAFSFDAWSTASGRLDVLAEKVDRLQSVDEARATHEARLAAIEASRFTRRDGESMRDRFDAQLLETWKELHRVKEGLTAAQEKERERIDRIMAKIEERLRAVENNR